MREGEVNERLRDHDCKSNDSRGEAQKEGDFEETKKEQA